MRKIIASIFLVLLLTALGAAQVPTTAPPPLPAATDTRVMTVPQLEARGDELRRVKMYDEALNYYRAAMQREKGNWVLQNKAGIAMLQMNKYRDAQKYFERSIKLNGKYAEAINNLGVVSYMRKDYGKAVKHYKRALALDETNASFHSNLGTAWFAQKKLDKAIVEYARALELDPDLLLRTSSTGMAARIASPEERALYAYTLAKLYARNGDIERSLRCLQMAKEYGYPKLRDVYREQEFSSVRTDPRLAQVVPPPQAD